jgi:hypothetical protein
LSGNRVFTLFKILEGEVQEERINKKSAKK